MKLSNTERQPFCDDLSKVQQLERDKRLEGTTEFLLATAQAEVSYQCRAGSQDACKSVQEQHEEEDLSEMKQQSRAMRASALANIMNAQATQQASHQQYMITTPGQPTTFVQPFP